MLKGTKSNLTDAQMALVRSPEFKVWFGDWENDPDNASVLCDENGVPLPVYHGTTRNFDDFSHDASKNFGVLDNTAHQVYFTSNATLAQDEYALIKESSLSKIARHFSDEKKDSLGKGLDRWTDFVEAIMDGKANIVSRGSWDILEYDGKQINREEVETFFDGTLPTRDNTKKQARKANGEPHTVYMPVNYNPSVKAVFLNIRKPHLPQSIIDYDFAFDGAQKNMAAGEDGVIVSHENLLEADGYSFSVSSLDNILCVDDPEKALARLKEMKYRNLKQEIEGNFPSVKSESISALSPKSRK